MNPPRGRFAPSPTGEMHLGNAWTAFLAWLYIRSQGGEMILRVEDLDPDRSRRPYVDLLMQDMKWLGLDWDEGPDIGGPYEPYYQSQRCDLYQTALAKLEGDGHLYPCYCSRAELQAVTMAPHAGDINNPYTGACRTLSDQERERRASQRKPALRLAVPDNEVITFCDGLQGEVSQALRQECGDFIVRRSDGVHAYQLAVTVDDALMKMSHVVRGDDLLSSTPRQIYLYKLLNFTIPKFVHVPLLYGEDGHRLSKRHGSLSLYSMRNRGIQPEKIVGFLAWKSGQTKRWESLKPKELVHHFRLGDIPCSPIIVENVDQFS